MKLARIRAIEARAAAHRRCPTNLDLIPAYSQVVVGDDKDVFIMTPEEVVQILPTSWWDKFAAKRRLVMKATHGKFGIRRVGRDFIVTFVGWLAVDRFMNNPDSSDVVLLESERRHDHEEGLQQQTKSRRRQDGGNYFVLLGGVACRTLNTLMPPGSKRS